MKMLIHAQTISGIVRDLQLSEPVIFADNEKAGRSGHVGHAMTEFAPGKLMVFSANTSAVRVEGHAAFGWMEYSISEDYGKTFSQPVKLPYAWDTFLKGIHTVSVEKAITLDNGEIAAFCLMNSQFSQISCEPWDCPEVVISPDQGKSWSDPIVASPFKGRIYDVLYQDGVAYVLLFCNDAEVTFTGNKPEHVYRLYRSEDNCRSFQEICVVPLDTDHRAYGNMIFTPAGDLIVYAYNEKDEVHMDYIISHDCGKTWETPGKSFVKNKIRNPQVGMLDGQYILHGRAGEAGEAGLIGEFVLYTSADGIHWDDGKILVTGRPASFYSENLTFTLPDGTQKMLVKYSENYNDHVPGVWNGQVNSMMLELTSIPKV